MMTNQDPLSDRAYQKLRRRLIDTGRRNNRLLNFPHPPRAAMVRVVDEELEPVFAHLSSDGRYRFRPLPDPVDEPTDEATPEFRAALAAAQLVDEEYQTAIGQADGAKDEARVERRLRDQVRVQLKLPRRSRRQSLDLDAWAKQNGVDPSLELPRRGRAKASRRRGHYLQTLLLPEQLRTRVAKIAANAKSVEQETGVATLHLAFGFLEWYESDQSDEAFLTPLLLLPVGLEPSKVRGGEEFHEISARDTKPQTNVALELRMSELRLTLPEFDGDHDAPVESYLAEVEHLASMRPRWRVWRYLTLAAFSFTKIAMYRDLDPANWGSSPASHPLVRPVIRAVGTEAWVGDMPAEHDIDDPAVEQIAPILVHDADSSQHSAIVDAMSGKNVVIQGPPGTGKSQTIANLIANAIRAGKTVLFVSEKMAALNVVKSRLDHANLGQLCLALHSTGARPVTVVKALEERAGQRRARSGGPSGAGAALARARDQLNHHVKLVHSVAGSSHSTVHRLIGRKAGIEGEHPEFPELLRAASASVPDVIETVAADAARDLLHVLDQSWGRLVDIGLDPRVTPWRCITRHVLFADEQTKLLACLEAVKATADSLQETCEPLVEACASEGVVTLPVLQGLIERVRKLDDPTPVVDRDILSGLATRDRARACADLGLAADAAAAAEAVLIAAGIRPQRAGLAERLQAATAVVTRLGVRDETVGQVPARAETEAANAERMRVLSPDVAALASAAGIEADPTLASIRIACQAAALAVRVDPAWASSRVPGLQDHVQTLRDGAARQTALNAEFAELSKVLDLEGGEVPQFMGAADGLSGAGLFAGLRSDVRDAKRFLASRWRGGKRLPKREAIALLRRAGAALGARDKLSADQALRAALGGADPDRVSLTAATAAAEWQAQVLAVLSGDGGVCRAMRDRLITARVEALSPLAALAERAESLVGPLAEGDKTWSQEFRKAQLVAQAWADLARLLQDIGIRADLRLDRLPELAHEFGRRAAAQSALDTDAARGLLRGTAPDASTLLATAAFAERAHGALPGGAAQVLGDGWTASIGRLRLVAAETARLVSGIRDNVPMLKGMGLGSVASVASDGSLAELREKAGELLAASAQLADYLPFANARAKCLADPLAAPLVTAFESQGAPYRNLAEALDWLVAWTLVRRCAEANRAAFARTEIEFSQAQRSFATADRDLIKAAGSAVLQAAAQRGVPRGDSTGPRREWTDWALLQLESSKRQRFAPLRDLLDRAGTAILGLTPCLMMSPLTVSQYLRPGHLTFDLVIMDEASQIRPEDALGALLRGRQAIIVGDQEQLPPTNFFERALEDDTDEDDAADDGIEAESVLDLARSAFQPPRRLRWHYRSRHHSLIAFSNREFYDNELVVFPAPHDRFAIEVAQMRGVWRGKVNVEEARAVARAAVRLMREYPGLSHGVVTMNQPQRELIEAEIAALAAGDENVTTYKERWENEHEPPFVKNLENVQGDERDVILISLGWGRTPEGALHQRFYPVNRSDGHRRLNVLFTRAKQRVVLFSSLRAEEIVVTPGKTARGVRVLRDYLLYARERRMEHGSVGELADSPFEESVLNALRNRGHDVVPQVGVSGYRIDIGVRHPENLSSFVLGIECDGATYHSARSARDRDRLREEALVRLGWRLVRVWSTDWFRDPVSCANRLDAEIRRAIAESEAKTDDPVFTDRWEPESEDTGEFQAELDIQIAGAVNGHGAEPPIAGGADEEEKAPDLLTALRRFRQSVIMVDFPGSEPNRSILREDMIEAIVRSELTDPDDFYTKIPLHLRSRTDGRQTQYLDRICGIVDEYLR